MKVAEVIQDNRFGGIAARSLLASVALRRRGVESVFVLPTNDGDVSARSQELGFDVVRTVLRRPHPRRPIQTLLWAVSFPFSVWQLCNVFRRNSVDVVHANGMICLQAAVASWLTRTPLIWHLAGTTMYPRLFSRLVLSAFSRKARMVFIADRVRRYFVGDAPVSPRERIIYEPVDFERIDDAKSSHVPGRFRQQIGVPEDGILVCTVANVTSLKGIDILLQAAVKLVDGRSNVYFAVVGQKLGTQRDFVTKLENEIRACGMASHFILCGHRDDIYHLLQDCDVFVLPSLSEGTPISILEAMAIGVPVIATAVGGIPEQIEHEKSGLLVSPGDPDSIVEAILRLLDNPELGTQLTRRAEKCVRERFSLDTFCARFSALLDECMPVGTRCL